MGQRNQLHWDIPVLDSFRLNQAIFRIPPAEFRVRLDELVELLELEDLLRKPVRNLSLGERMKCEIAGSLLHAPAVLFLDEPTIGLDVAMQRRIRSFIAEYNAPHRRLRHADQSLHGRCRGAVPAGDRHPPGTLLYDGDLTGLVAALRRAQDDHGRARGGCAGRRIACGWAGERGGDGTDRDRVHGPRSENPDPGGGQPAAGRVANCGPDHRGAAGRSGDREGLRRADFGSRPGWLRWASLLRTAGRS